MVQNLNLFKLVDGVQVPFPNEDSQVEIFDYTYTAKRMGGAPSITATVMHVSCLDDVWDETVHTEFNGERYFLKQTPTSSKTNDDARYKHELEMVSERIILDNVYFYDVVSADFNDYKPVTNSTKVVFFGNIEEFVARLNESLKYAKLQRVVDGEVQGYNVVIDSGITSDGKLITFEDQFFSGVLQEIFNVYELPYYFVGKTIHIGFEPITDVVLPTFQYGADNELLSITKSNANNKIVNRVTGQGSADNIPYYYPNMSEKGDLEAKYYSAENGAVLTDKVRIINGYLYGKNIDTGSSLEFKRETSVGNFSANTYKYSISSDRGRSKYNYIGQPLSYKFPETDTSVIISFERDLQITSAGLFRIPIQLYQNGEKYFNSAYISELKIINKSTNESLSGIYNDAQEIHTPRLDIGTYTLSFIYQVPYMGYVTTQSSDSYTTQLFMGDIEGSTEEYWYDSHKKVSYTSLTKVGLKLNEGVTPQVGNVILQELVGYIQPQETLMPSIYRESEGVERFYNAINDTYVDDEGNDIEFNNPYIDGKPKEQIVQFEDIKPTIKEMTNAQGLRIDMFSEFAYDDDDNDETEEIEGTIHYKHPYFFAKLRKTDGEHAFNLFDSAIDEGEKTISMTSGHCGGCNFKVMVSDDDLKQNTVQVYETDVFDSSGKIIHKRGDLKRDEKGNVICGRENYQSPVTGQAMQQDTVNNEVWIALEKDLETYGTMMPSRVVNDNEQETVIRPSVDDTFVILHINLPEAYITAAEERLEKEIIKYMKENNDEKFTFSIKFSRIYLGENPQIANAINENSVLKIAYNGHEYSLYNSSYTYKVSHDTPIPEITVDLKDEITVSQNALQQAITEVKGDFQTAFKNLDILNLCGPYFLRKDADDRSAGKISASMGFEAGGYVKGRSGAKIDEYGQAEVENLNARSGVFSNEFTTQNYISGILGAGAKLWVDENNKANLEVDNITARESFKVTELVIQKVNSVGGVLVVSATNGVIENVEAIYKQNSNNENTLDVDYYEVTFGTDSSFQNNDIIRCSYWDNTTKELRSYWYPIVVSPTNATSNVVQAPYGNLPTNNGVPIIPKVGDKVAQMGNTTNANRQGVIVISTENNKPFISIYDGVNTNALNASKLRGRFGDLSGLTFNGKDLNGYGIWSNNAYLTGELKISSSGKTIEDEISNQITNDASSRNYARMTAIPINITNISIGTNITQRIYDIYGFTNGDTLTISFDWEAKGIDFANPDSFISMQFSDSYGYISAGFRLKSSNITPDVVNKGTHTHTLTLQGKWDSNSQTASLPILKSDNGWLYLLFDNVAILNGYGYLKISNLRVNKGKISHDWEVALEDANAELNAYKEVVTQELNTLQSQIDGQVESWFYDYSPTTDNLPASQWTTDALKEAHIGDTFTNTQEYVDDTNTPDAGKSWRWLNKDGVYGWYPISDSDATKALLLASQAKDTADNKRRVFVSTPTPPYDEGDLWVNATYGDYIDEILKCVMSRASGASFSIDDWTKASKYTDDSATSELQKEVYKYFEVADGHFTSIQGAIINNASQGRNILLGTNQGTANWALGTSLSPEMYSQSKVIYNGEKGIKISKVDSATIAGWEVFRYALRPQFICANKTYRLSFDARNANIGEGNNLFSVMIATGGGGDRLTQNVAISLPQDGLWHYYDIELNAVADGSIDGTQIVYMGMVLNQTPYWEEISFVNIKLEQSTTATPWSPAPEDAVEGLNTLANTVSTIEQTATDIRLDVDNLDDGLKATGINIEDKAIIVSANKFTITNNSGETTTSVDAQGNLAVSSVACRYNDGNEGTTPFVADWNAKGDGIQRWYYSNGNIRAEVGWDDDTESFIRKFDENGILLWKIGNPAEFTTYNEPIWEKIILSERYSNVLDIPKNNTYIDGITYYKKTNANDETNNTVYKSNVGENLSPIDDGFYTNSGLPFKREIASSMPDIAPAIKYVRKVYKYTNGKLTGTTEVMWE